MKELSIEEKAKAYDEAITIIQDWYNHCTTKEEKKFIEKSFPQFKELDDERIRKDIVTYLQQSANSATLRVNAQKFNKWIAWFEKQSEQKSAWSEKDERMFKNTIALIETIEDYNKAPDGFGDVKFWLKSLKGRVLPQNFNVTDKELAQAKKDAYNDALNKIEYHSGELTFDDGWSAAIWYLKKRNAQPQSTWKPSDEQMGALWDSIKHNLHLHPVLKSLYNDLKKLREE